MEERDGGKRVSEAETFVGGSGHSGEEHGVRTLYT